MANYCVKRDGMWRFVRRVPKEYAALDKRRIIQHSTGISVAEDPRGIRAKKVANELNFDLETYLAQSCRWPERASCPRL